MQVRFLLSAESEEAVIPIEELRSLFCFIETVGDKRIPNYLLILESLWANSFSKILQTVSRGVKVEAFGKREDFPIIIRRSTV